jgi:hypothetical protein
MTFIDPSYQIAPGIANISTGIVTLDINGFLPVSTLPLNAGSNVTLTTGTGGITIASSGGGGGGTPGGSNTSIQFNNSGSFGGDSFITYNSSTHLLYVNGPATLTGQVIIGGNLREINGVLYAWPGVQGASASLLINDGSGALNWTTASVLGLVSGTGTANQIAFWNGLSSISGNTNLYWDSTNDRLGVGTSSPTTPLQVHGIIYSDTGGFKFPDNSVQLTAAMSNPPGGSTGNIQYNAGAGSFGGSANLFWDNTNVRLGVGTNSPGEQVVIFGSNIRPIISDKVTHSQIYPSYNSETWNALEIKAPDGNGFYAGLALTGNSSGLSTGGVISFSNIGGGTPGTNDLRLADISGFPDGAVNSGYISIRTSNVHTMTEAMRIDHLQRVGIQTSTPAYALDVTGDINLSGVYRTGGTPGVSGTFTSQDGHTVTVTNGIITSIV